MNSFGDKASPASYRNVPLRWYLHCIIRPNLLAVNFMLSSSFYLYILDKFYFERCRRAQPSHVVMV